MSFRFTALDWCELALSDLHVYSDIGVPSPELIARMETLIPLIMNEDSVFPMELWPDGDGDVSLSWRGGKWSIDVSLYEDDGKPHWFVMLGNEEPSERVHHEGEGELPPTEIIELLRSEVEDFTRMVNDVSPKWKEYVRGDEKRWAAFKLKKEAVNVVGIKGAVSDGWL